MRPIFAWSLAISCGASLFAFVLLATGPGHHDLLYNADILLVVLATGFMQVSLRRSSPRRMTYLRTLGAGTVACTLAAALSRAVYYFYLAFIDDSLFAMLTNQWRQALSDRGLDPAAVEERLEALHLSAGQFAWSNFIAFIVPAFALIAVVSIFTRYRASAS